MKVEAGRRLWVPALQVVFVLAFFLCSAALAEVIGNKDELRLWGTGPAITPIPSAPNLDQRKVQLGAFLFNDPRLSGNGKRTCASCHDLSTNGADSRQRDIDPVGNPVNFNTSTVFNASLNYRMNWEGNAKTLEQAAAMSISDPQLMGANMANVIRKLNSDHALRNRFSAIYKRGPDEPSLLDAISVYERSLVTPGSRFDLWLKGDKTALSQQEIEGYKLFTSFGCISCHQGVNVGGNLFEQSGIFHPLGSLKKLTLRVPSLRNVAVTGPYFHDGSVSSLDAVVLEMGYAQLDRRLSYDQVQAVVAFLKSLTGRYQGRLLAPASP